MCSVLHLSPPGVRGVPPWVWWTTVISVWGAVVLTVYSGVVYVLAAVRLLHREPGDDAA
jgi:hypothetical protein